MLNYSINSIYRATEGEGIFIGTPQVFVRFQGCAVGCVNCDSLETWEFVQPNMDLGSVLKKISSESLTSIKRVSITGGDPLHPKNEKQVLELTKELKKLGYFVNIEAAGTRCVDSVFDELDFVSFDFKTPSTGVKFNEKVFEKFINKYSNKSQIKAVVADQRDFNAYYELAQKFKKDNNNWVITPCYEPNEDFPLARFKEIIDINEKTGSLFRVIGQQHKWLHGPDKKNI